MTQEEIIQELKALSLFDKEETDKEFNVGDKVKLSPYAIMCFMTAQIEERDPRYHTGEYFDDPFIIFKAEEKDIKLGKRLNNIHGVIRKITSSEKFDVEWENDDIGIGRGFWGQRDLNKIHHN